MGYRLNRLDKPVFIAVSKPLLTEFDIHQRLESCAVKWNSSNLNWKEFSFIAVNLGILEEIKKYLNAAAEHTDM